MPFEAIEVRPARPGDEEPVRRFLAGLSLRTQTLRFFTGVSRPSRTLLRALLAVDGNRDALLAVPTGTGEVVGHAMSYAREGGADVEVAIVVADEWQGMGCGARLMDALLGRAAARGARTAAMDVMGENRRVLAMIRRRWPGAAMRVCSGTVEVVVRIPAAPDLNDLANGGPRVG
ncbi:hypothetical protein GCM10023259_090540 [Thermocatellispora tengchongensis]